MRPASCPALPCTRPLTLTVNQQSSRPWPQRLPGPLSLVSVDLCMTFVHGRFRDCVPSLPESIDPQSSRPQTRTSLAAVHKAHRTYACTYTASQPHTLLAAERKRTATHAATSSHIATLSPRPTSEGAIAPARMPTSRVCAADDLPGFSPPVSWVLKALGALGAPGGLGSSQPRRLTRGPGVGPRLGA